MNKVNVLPRWVLPDTLPSVYDTESGTCIEMTAKVYGATRELQEKYNSFIEEIETKINEYLEQRTIDYDTFTADINKIVHNYIKMLDEKVKLQDLKINDSVVYIKENLMAAITQLIEEMLESGVFDEATLNAIDNIGTRVVTLETNSTNQEGRISSLESDNTSTKAKVETLETTTTNLTNKIGNVETSVGTITSNVNDLQQANIDNEERLSTIENTIIEFEYNEDTKELNLVTKVVE